ncbi:hypothetical protein JFY59_08800 [Porphyromonas gingivalis]|uniref:hypothetical protein n=1 Tax=Porphyromonas gingivalis TaxID=837 RepID=UPI001F3A8EDB|nr:hypothetical protein [Porphyromonas gingivalis]MCE8190279.1 hypothetical protein [Porphyromonas gingivalis]
MKTKVFILLLFFVGCVSCDISTPFIIDGQKEYVISGECGTIKIRGPSLPTHSIPITCTFNGSYHINTDSLKIEADPNGVIVTNVRFRLNGEVFAGTEIETKTGETLSIWFDVKSETSYKRSEVTVLILPSNFITCEGKSIISDTIRIQLKN